MSSTESPVSVTVKTAAGSLVTLRADTTSQFIDLVLEAQRDGLFGPAVADFEQIVRSQGGVEAAAVANVVNNIPTQSAPAFAPVAPPVVTPTAAGQRTCAHGTMTFREGMGAKGPWKGYFCPIQDKAQQCKPQWVK